MQNRVYLDTKPLSEALSLWEGRLSAMGIWSPLQAERIAVPDALGRITAEAISARISSPHYHASAMDGYAVRFTDTVGASERTPKRLTLGQEAHYVDTGDPIPKGYNAVIMVEDVTVVEGAIEIIAAVPPWKHVRTVGEDIVATELIAPESHRVRPVDIGAMLAGGHTEVMVRRKPRVAVIPTGTEIVEPGTPLVSGSIIEYNAQVLGAMVSEWGGEFVRHPIVPDDPDQLRQAVLRCIGDADLVVTNAGASAGSEDYTERVISELGEVVLHGVNIKPGKPVILGTVQNKPVIGVPGYPVSAYITFTLFARPLLMAWLGTKEHGAETLRANLSRQVASQLGHEEFIRVKVGCVSERFVATPLGRGAGLIMSLVRADGIVRVPEMSEGIGAGTEVEVELLRTRTDIEHTVVSIGSHDQSMDILANALKKRYPDLSLSSAHVGSMGGLMALKKGEAHIAPTHLLDEETGEYNVPFIKRLLEDRNIVLINLVHREQGLMVPKGNPKGIRGFGDLTREDVVFINRQRGAGTRLLLDKNLRELGIDPSAIQGYESEEFTHMAVASAVLTGVADAGLGVLSAARALGLDFIPVAKERYDLAIPAELMEAEMIQAVLDIIRTDTEFRETVVALGGYDVTDMGTVMWEG